MDNHFLLTRIFVKFLILFAFMLTVTVPVHGQSVCQSVSSRIKPGDILYVDGMGEERYIDYHDWDSSEPPGTALGVVFYAYYGRTPYEVSNDIETEPEWHGWIVSVEEDSCIWCPTTSPCYNTCVANYEVGGINTPNNPYHPFNIPHDTSGWQSTYRILDFIYEGQNKILSNSVMPPLYWIFSMKNGVTDFSTMPAMGWDSWYMPSDAQYSILYGYLGCVNAAMTACGGIRFRNFQRWLTCTERGGTYPRKIQVMFYTGKFLDVDNQQTDKKYGGALRAVRNF